MGREPGRTERGRTKDPPQTRVRCHSGPASSMGGLVSLSPLDLHFKKNYSVGNIFQSLHFKCTDMVHSYIKGRVVGSESPLTQACTFPEATLEGTFPKDYNLCKDTAYKSLPFFKKKKSKQWPGYPAPT